MWEEPEKRPALRGGVGKELAPDEAPTQATCWSVSLQTDSYLDCLCLGISDLLLLLEARTSEHCPGWFPVHTCTCPSCTACPPVPSSAPSTPAFTSYSSAGS